MADEPERSEYQDGEATRQVNVRMTPLEVAAVKHLMVHTGRTQAWVIRRAVRTFLSVQRMPPEFRIADIDPPGLAEEPKSE